MESGTAQLLPPDRPDVLSIGALLDQVQAAITRAFPRGQLVWVRGEVQSITDRTGHCYIDLVDPEAPTRARRQGAEDQLLAEDLGAHEGGPGPAGDRPRGRDRGDPPGSGRVLRPPRPGQFHRRRCGRRRPPGSAGGPESRPAEGARSRGPPPSQRLAGAARSGLEDRTGGQSRDRGVQRFPRPTAGIGVWPSPSWSWPPRCRGPPPPPPWPAASPRWPTPPVIWWCSSAAAGPRPTWWRSIPSLWLGPSPSVRCRSGRGSVTPGTSRWPTSWPVVPSSLPPSAARSWSGGPGTGGSRWPPRPGWWHGGPPRCWRAPSSATGRPGLASVRPPGTSCTATPNVSTPGRDGSPPRPDGSSTWPRWRWTSGPPASVLVPTSAVAHQAERVESWRRLLAAYDVDRQLERGYTLTLGEDGRIVRSVALIGDRVRCSSPASPMVPPCPMCDRST